MRVKTLNMKANHYIKNSIIKYCETIAIIQNIGDVAYKL